MVLLRGLLRALRKRTSRSLRVQHPRVLMVETDQISNTCEHKERQNLPGADGARPRKGSLATTQIGDSPECDETVVWKCRRQAPTDTAVQKCHREGLSEQSLSPRSTLCAAFEALEPASGIQAEFGHKEKLEGHDLPAASKGLDTDPATRITAEQAYHSQGGTGKLCDDNELTITLARTLERTEGSEQAHGLCSLGQLKGQQDTLPSKSTDMSSADQLVNGVTAEKGHFREAIGWQADSEASTSV